MVRTERQPSVTYIEGRPIPQHLYRIEQLDEEQMAKTVTKELLRIEEIRYRNGWVYPAEAKLLFLVGTEEIDVTKAVTSTGIPIYTKEATHVKAPEIIEAISAISDHFERERNVPNVLLELADVWYNLLQLTQMDPDFEATYQKCIDQLCSTVGYSRRQAFKLTLLKYKVRFIDNGGTNRHAEELKEIESQLRNEHGYFLPTPGDEEFNNTYRLLNKMSATILQPRLLQIQTLQAWKRSQWYPKSQEWEIRRGDPNFPGMYMNKTTVSLFDLFKESTQIKPRVVMQPILVSLDDADMSLSSVFPNIRYVTRSRPLADTLAHLGFKAYRQDPFRFKSEEEIDLLWLNANREVLLNNVCEGGYVVQSVGNEYILRVDYKPVGVLTFERYSGKPIYDTYKPWEYRTKVATDEEFQKVSPTYYRDLRELSDEVNEQTDIPLSFSGHSCITFDQAVAVVRDVTGQTTNIVENYIQILNQYKAENQTGPLHEVFRNRQVVYTALPDKRYGFREAYYVFQRAKYEVNRYPGYWVRSAVVDKGSVSR